MIPLWDTIPPTPLKSSIHSMRRKRWTNTEGAYNAHLNLACDLSILYNRRFSICDIIDNRYVQYLPWWRTASLSCRGAMRHSSWAKCPFARIWFTIIPIGRHEALWYLTSCPNQLATLIRTIYSSSFYVRVVPFVIISCVRYTWEPSPFTAILTSVASGQRNGCSVWHIGII